MLSANKVPDTPARRLRKAARKEATFQQLVEEANQINRSNLLGLLLSAYAKHLSKVEVLRGL